LAFSGEIETPSPDEVIFADAADQVHARRWTFRQSRRSVINPDTTYALIVSEGLHETAAADVRALINILAEKIASLWSPPRYQKILSAEAPRLDFD
jgi:DNA/RNA-binding domain of Phe-tRNA-synthetase-like protein